MPSQLDAILADRDTLLADREDRDRDDRDSDDRDSDDRDSDDRDSDDRGWDRPSGNRGGPAGPGYRSGYEPPSYDRPPSYEQPPSYGERDWDEEPYRRPSDPTAQLPQIHQPRRGDSSGRNEVVRPEQPLPPSRRPQDRPPPGTDPADD